MATWSCSRHGDLSPWQQWRHGNSVTMATLAPAAEVGVFRVLFLTGGVICMLISLPVLPYPKDFASLDRPKKSLFMGKHGVLIFSAAGLCFHLVFFIYIFIFSLLHGFFL